MQSCSAASPGHWLAWSLETCFIQLYFGGRSPSRVIRRQLIATNKASTENGEGSIRLLAMYLWISGSRHSSNGSLYMKPVHGRVVPSCTQAQANLMSSSSYGSCTIVVITNLIFAPVLVVYNRLRVLVLLRLLLLLLLLLRTTTTTRPVPLAGPTFLACLRKMVMIRMLMRTMMMGAFRHISDRVGGRGG